MCTFFIDTFKPEIFWTALSAIGTLLAVLIALFLPSFNEYKRVNRIVRLIEGEISRNYRIAKNADSGHDIPFPDGSTHHVVLSAQDTARLFKLDLWKEYKYKLADDRPESFEKYQGICQHIDALSDLNQIHEKLRPVKFKGEIDLFVKKCQEELKLV